MKISYSNYPALEKLHNGKFGKMDTCQVDVDYFFSKEWRVLYEKWKENRTYFSEEIIFISQPFQDACEKVGNRLLDFLKEMVENKELDLSFNGTFIESGGFVYMMKYRLQKETGVHFISLYWFHNNSLDGCYYNDDNPSNALLWMSDQYKKGFNINSIDQEMEEVNSIMSRYAVFKLFKSYAEVETKELKANSKLEEVNCKYVNDTQFPVTYMDSKWFTNLVKSEGFNVRGHLRLQACGTGLSQHKLIWINEYTKTGYTAPARMLKQNRN